MILVSYGYAVKEFYVLFSVLPQEIQSFSRNGVRASNLSIAQQIIKSVVSQLVCTLEQCGEL